MKRWLLFSLLALVVAAGCGDQGASTKAEGKVVEPKAQEAGKGAAQTSNNELSINPNAGNTSQFGSGGKKK